MTTYFIHLLLTQYYRERITHQKANKVRLGNPYQPAVSSALFRDINRKHRFDALPRWQGCQRLNVLQKMKRRLLDIILVAIAVIVGVTFGSRYLAGSWAPSSFDGGLNFSEAPKVIDSRGNELPEQPQKGSLKSADGCAPPPEVSEDPGGGPATRAVG